MFVRAKTRFKDGKTHRYWSVVENHRNRDGRVVQRQVLYLGEINDSQRAAWCRSIEVIDGDTQSRQMALFASDRGGAGAGVRGGAGRGPRRASAAAVGRVLAGAGAVGSAGVGSVLAAAAAGESARDALAGRAQDAGLLPVDRAGQRVAPAPALVRAQCDGGSAGRSAGAGEGHAVPLSGQAAGASPGVVLAPQGALADAVRGALRRAALRSDEHLL